ncbi:DUF6361 family protein [Bacteroidota bacterium]
MQKDIGIQIQYYKVMAASFGWIDFSDEQRDRVNAVIDMLSAGGTIDELGVGSVRDALGDWMFPGVSTIQTRPKYFIILTEILQNYIRKNIKKEKIKNLDDYLTNEENRIMHLLAKNHDYKEGDGVIGIKVAKENGELARKASFIYWNGLRIHGFINTHLSRTQYVKEYDVSALGNDVSDEELSSHFDHNFEIKGHQLNVINEDMKLDLNMEQAKFIKDQLLDTTHPQKQNYNLLTQLLKDRKREEIVLSAANFREAAELLLEVEDLPSETKAILRIALDFDLLMNGAHIRYNIQLHKKAGTNNYDDLWQEWLLKLETSRFNIERLDFNYVFSEIATGVDTQTQRFMKSWQEEILKANRNEIVLDKLVYNQEISKKGNKAKLILKDGEYQSWVGISGLEYRFNIVKNIIKDLQAAYA